MADLFREQGGQTELDTLDTPAAQQMLLYHYSQGNDAQTWHDLHGALGGFLRDPNIRTVGVSSGRIGGELAKTVSVPASTTVTEGAAGGTSDAIDRMRNTLESSNFKTGSLDPDIAAKPTNTFIPFASALMLDGIGPADLVSADTVRAASAFDEMYFETEENLPHLHTSTNWFGKEVLALLDAP
jgi:hypothetical protein